MTGTTKVICKWMAMSILLLAVLPCFSQTDGNLLNPEQ